MRNVGNTSKRSSINSESAQSSLTLIERGRGLLHQAQKSVEQSWGEVCSWPVPAGRRWVGSLDLPLLLTVSALVAFGLLMVYSSSFIHAQARTGDGFSFIKKQLVFAVIGFVALVLGTRIHYRRWFHWAYPALGVATVMLAAVLLPGIGARVGGAQRWLRLGGINFQPGELAKFAVILFAAVQLERKFDRLSRPMAGLLSPFLVPLPALLLLLAQPDFGTTVMISVVLFCLMFLAGVPKRHLALALGLAGAVGAALVLGTPYRRMRLMTFLDPWSDPGGKGFQILQSLVGLHHGGISGVGLGNGKEKLLFLPEAHNDFIFAVIGEELGLIGVAGVALTYLYFVYRGLQLSWDAYGRSLDRFALFLGTGITLALGIQGFVNMAVAMGLLPTKGLTLPLISYGGSALIVDLFAIGVLLAIGRGTRPVGEIRP
jgi:cell division protein FtsW